MKSDDSCEYSNDRQASGAVLGTFPTNALHVQFKDVSCFRHPILQYLAVNYVEKKMVSTSDLEVIVIGAGWYTAVSVPLD